MFQGRSRHEPLFRSFALWCQVREVDLWVVCLSPRKILFGLCAKGLRLFQVHPWGYSIRPHFFLCRMVRLDEPEKIPTRSLSVGTSIIRRRSSACMIVVDEVRYG